MDLFTRIANVIIPVFLIVTIGYGYARRQLLLFAALPPAVMRFMLANRVHQEPDKVGAMIMLGNALAMAFVSLALAIGL